MHWKVLLALAFLGHASIALAEEAPAVARGRYLVAVAGCCDCHTPGHFLGKPDATRLLGGSDVGFEIPGLGSFYGPNLTPDPTGLWQWSEAEIVTAIRTGQRPDGRMLAPAMPWMNLASLTDADAFAVAAYLKSLPQVAHTVPGPIGPGEATGGLVMRIEQD